MAAEPACLARADGSARFSHGATEVLVAVYGPCEAKRTRERPDCSVLECIVRPLAGLPGPVEREMEQLLNQTLSHLVLVAQHPRTAISVVVQVLADDGSLLATALPANKYVYRVQCNFFFACRGRGFLRERQ